MAFDKLGTDATKVAPKVEDFFKNLRDMELIPGLKVGVWGPPEVGKTFFIGTCPEPIYYIDTEFGGKPVYKNWFPDKDIRSMECRVIGKDPTQVDAEATFNKVEEAIFSLVNSKPTQGTVAIDSMSDIYGWMNEWVEQTTPKVKSKTSGEDFMMRTEWGKRNSRYRFMVFQLISLPINIVFTAQPKEEYKGGKGTGHFEGRWLEQHDHWVDVVLKMEKWDSTPIKYYSTIEKCRMHRAPGVRIEDCTYPLLLRTLDDKFGLKITGQDYTKIDEQVKFYQTLAQSKLKVK